jgi:hypothetical protein
MRSSTVAHRVRDGADNAARFVENGDHALARLFDQIADDLVVEVVDLQMSNVTVPLERGRCGPAAN